MTVSISGQFAPGQDALSALVQTKAGEETYKGETYVLERRDIASFLGPDRRVWVWEVTSGPAKGQYGGKCGTKAEARKWARHAIREIGPEFERMAAEAAAQQS